MADTDMMAYEGDVEPHALTEDVPFRALSGTAVALGVIAGLQSALLS